VELLMLITSLALLARSRAWVVFRWVGVAAPAQRCIRGTVQRIAAGIPDRRGCCRGCRAAVRMLRHKGSECGLLGGSMEMAEPPLSHVARPSLGEVRSPGAGLAGTRSSAGNPPGHRPTPLSAGRLRMTSASDFIVHLAMPHGKCQNQVHPACIIGTVPKVGTIGPGL